jgi:hypothetical protein
VIAAGVGFDASPGNAQEVHGTLTLHGEFQSCYVVDDGPGLKTVYVTHNFIPGATAVRFRVQPYGSTMIYVSETHNFPMTVGNAQDGMSVCYGSCLLGPIPVATLTYMSYGTSAPCGQLEIVPHPAAEVPEVVLCDGRTVQTAAQDVNAGTNVYCGCPEINAFPGAPRAFDCEPLAVHASTWGGIKALYRE